MYFFFPLRGASSLVAEDVSETVFLMLLLDFFFSSSDLLQGRSTAPPLGVW